MAQHYLLSAELRDYSLMDIQGLSEEDAFWVLTVFRWGKRTEQVCPKCGTVDSHYFRRGRWQWRCKHCARTFSLTSGTPLADRKIGFRKILLGCYLFVSAAKGFSAAHLARMLGVQVKTAWLFMHKLREPLLRQRDVSPLTNMVHIDGGHFGGKPRKGRVRKKKKNSTSIAEKIQSRGKQRSKRTPNDIRNWLKRKKNRRIVMVLREVSLTPKTGAVRTIVSVAMSENERDAIELARRHVEPGALIRTDENPAYNRLSSWFEHETVEHSKEYATIDGIDSNQAESYFSRLRRFEYGTIHRVSPQYLMDYANEMAWREDYRRKTEKAKLTDLLEKLFFNGLSRWWRGYHQGYRRTTELLMT